MTRYNKFVKVAGVTFEDRQSILEQMVGNELVELKPEPENEYDPNAIAVWVTFPPEAQTEPAKIGYIPKPITTEVALMSKHRGFEMGIYEITGGFMINEVERAAIGLTLLLSAEYDNRP